MTVYRYICSNNHELRSPDPLDACVGSIDGIPCDGALRPTAGVRTRRAGRRAKAQHQTDHGSGAWPNAS